MEKEDGRPGAWSSLLQRLSLVGVAGLPSHVRKWHDSQSLAWPPWIHPLLFRDVQVAGVTPAWHTDHLRAGVRLTRDVQVAGVASAGDAGH